jgi:homoserine O-succinyltransferase/O-acetyltransferase
MKMNLKIAVLDLNNGVENQGIRCIKGLLDTYSDNHKEFTISYSLFDVRQFNEVPDLSFDAYISSGGPGSPYDGVGTLWESRYFSWLDQLWDHNQNQDEKKHALLICHSFQLMCRHFDLAEVVRRKSDSFGIMPVHLTENGRQDPLLSKLKDTFYAADFREWQVLQPKTTTFRALGASILAIEKERPHVPLERALMALRVSNEIIGTQFHPEADPEGMAFHFSKTETRDKIRNRHGDEKFEQLMTRLQDPEYLLATYETFIPSFLDTVITSKKVLAI